MVRPLIEAILSDAFVRFLADATIKATLLLLVSWLFVVALRRSSAALRHRIWALALGGLIALPVVSWLVPGWGLPIWPAPAQLVAPIGGVSVNEPPVLTVLPVERGDNGVRALPRMSEVPIREAMGRPETRSVRALTIDEPTISPAEERGGWTLAGGLLMLWGVGFLVALLPTILGVFANEWTRWRARRVIGEEWRALLDTLRRSMSIVRNVELLQSEASPIPLTWGVVRTVILLPDDAEGWPQSTRRTVLLHELAHIQRLDAGFQLIGRLAAALYWFHPLAWYALHRLRVEGEHACDDCVVLAGERPTEYARQLLDLARSVRMPRFAMAVAMARSNTLERRMRAMFDDTLSHAALGHRTGRLVGVGAVLLALILATLHPGPPAASSKPPAETVGSAAVTSSESPGNESGQVVGEGVPDPQPKGNGRITGRVVRDAGRNPVGGAEVVLLPPPPKGQNEYYGKLPLRRTTADVKGTFSFDGLAPGRYRVWANLGKLTSRPRHIRGEVVILPESGEAPKAVELRLVPGVRVTVRVKEKATGKPIPNATVQPGWSDLVDDFTTDRDGQVQAQPFTPERWMLEVWADGFAKESRWLNLENGSDAEVEFLLEPGGDLEGIVRDPSGKPVSGVGLSIFLEGSNQQFAYVETDAGGRYQLDHLPLNIALRILELGKGDYIHEAIPIRLTHPRQELNLTLRLRPHGGSIAGIVLDHDGRPIAGAELINPGNSSAISRRSKTGPNGRFRLENLYATLTGKEVIVRAKGHAPKRLTVEPGPAGNPAEVTIALEPGHRIKGRVTDDKGRPIEGVDVYFSGGNHGDEGGGKTTTDAQGRFDFDSLPVNSPFAFGKPGAPRPTGPIVPIPEGSLPFTFYKEAYSGIENRQLPLDGDDVVTVEMAPAGVILGKVLDATTGRPIRGFNVQITFSPKRQPGEPSSGLRSDLINPGQVFQSNEGHFKLGELLVGMPLQVMISAQGYERHVTERVVVAVPNEAPVEEFRLSPLDAADLRTYRGRLIDARRKPVAGAQLRLFAARDRNPNRRSGFPFNWSMIRNGQLAQQSNVTRFLEAATDAQGRFEFTRIPRGNEVELAWWGTGIAPGRVDYLDRMEEKASIEITVPNPARIVVTVDRKAFSGAGRIQVNSLESLFDDADRELKPGQTEFAFDDLAPGQYRVSLTSPFERVPGTSNGLTMRTLASLNVTVDPGETKRVEFKE